MVVTSLGVGCVVIGGILLLAWLNTGPSTTSATANPIETHVVLVSSSTTTEASPARGWLGVSAADVPDGVEVTECEPGSPAATSLRSGDVILAFNGQSVTKLSELVGFLRNSKSGSLAQISIERQGTHQTVAVVLAAKR
jgi:S1-C subfamily serine protease